jgi:hypothetical protein
LSAVVVGHEYEPMDDKGRRSHSDEQVQTAKDAFSPRGKPPVPPGTPDEIRDRIVWEPRKPIPLIRPIPAHPATGETTAKHRLVVLGDSISQGFKSLAIHETKLSWPAMVAHYGGLGRFRYPWFDGPEECPGLPFNVEAAVKTLNWPGSLVDPRAPRLLDQIRRLMNDVEHYWERGEGSTAVDAATADGFDLSRVHHNLAIWGQDIRDALSLDVTRLKNRVRTDKNRRNNALNQFVSAPGERSALITLEGGGADDTPVSLATKLGEDGGIETLVVALGANNILSTVIDFDIKWSGDGYDDVDRKRAYNAWTPAHFRAEFDVLLERVKQINAANVIVFTVPHVTIVPMVRGVGSKMPGDRYFARYTRPWITDDAFRSNFNACLTGAELRALDFAVDLYNTHIEEQVLALDDPNGRRWAVLDTAGILDRLAYRRYLIDDESRPDWWTPYDLPDAYRELSPLPDTRFFRSDRFGRIEGGLFALDGVHPTTIGYGIIAREVMNLMTALGVPLVRTEPDFYDLIEQDTMIADPPAQLASVLTAAATANHIADLYQTFRHGTPI